MWHIGLGLLVLLVVIALLLGRALGSLSESDVPQNQLEPVLDHHSSLVFDVRWQNSTIPFSVVNESLNSNMWTISLNFSDITEHFKVLLKLHNIRDCLGSQVQLYLLNLDGYLVFVEVSCRFVCISESQLHLIGKWTNNILILKSNFLVERVFHHLQNHIGLDELEYAVLELVTLIPNRGGDEHLAHGIPVKAYVLQLLQLHDGARVLLSLLCLLLYIRVQQYVSDRESKGKWICPTKEIIFVSDVNILNVVLDSSKKPGCKTKQRWLLEFSLCFNWLGALCAILPSLLGAWLPPSHLCFFCLRLLNLLGPLVNFLSYSRPYRLSICSLLHSPVIIVLSLRPPNFMYDPMHQHNVCNLIFRIIFASLWILMEMLRLGHLVLIWTKNKMNIAEFQLERLREQVPDR